MISESFILGFVVGLVIGVACGAILMTAINDHIAAQNNSRTVEFYDPPKRREEAN